MSTPISEKSTYKQNHHCTSVHTISLSRRLYRCTSYTRPGCTRCGEDAFRYRSKRPRKEKDRTSQRFFSCINSIDYWCIPMEIFNTHVFVQISRPTFQVSFIRHNLSNIERILFQRSVDKLLAQSAYPTVMNHTQRLSVYCRILSAPPTLSSRTERDLGALEYRLEPITLY